MNIAIDYDDTFTADRLMWSEIITVMLKHRHKVTFVTARVQMREGWDSANSDIEHDASALNIPIKYTNNRQKSEVFTADIWCDDSPEMIPSIDLIKSIARLDEISR